MPRSESIHPAHPLADLIPTMSDEEYVRLRDDIAANGLLDAVTLYEGQVLDGRHRLRACEETSTEPRYVQYDGDSPAQFVLSHNLHRRHLSVSQRAMIATDFLPHLETEARARPHLQTSARDSAGHVLPNASSTDERLGLSSQRAAEAVGVGAPTVQRAKRVAEEAPELAQQVRDGDLTINAARDIVVERRKSANSEPKGDNGHVRPSAIQRIAAQASALAMAIDAVNLTKSCARLSDDERAESLQNCKTGLKALNALANALGR